MMKYFFILFIVFLAACSVEETGNPFLDNPRFCNVDADCTFGGIDTSGDCFVGNKLYASMNVDASKHCSEFDSAEVKCVRNECRLVQLAACPEDAKVCPDGTVISRVGPDCEFLPCPNSCESDEDCVPASCCHSTGCVPKSKAPTCDGVMCTMECQPNTLDCGGSCSCIDGECVANLV